MRSRLRAVLAVTSAVGFAQLACESTPTDDAAAGTGGGAAAAGGTTSGAGGTTSGAGGAAGAGGGGGFRPMECDEGDEYCVCDESGCLIGDGGLCTGSEQCLHGFCAATRDSDNVCCAEACDAEQACLGDGSACETAGQCVENEFRCAGDYLQCIGGEWQTIDDCGDRGCDVDFGGCLLPVGAACVADEDCGHGEGTCQTIVGGDKVCCEASCGPCAVCSSSGNACEVPPLAELGDACVCTEEDLSNCADGPSCAPATCTDGVCSYPIDSMYCLIDGQCYEHDSPAAGNPCRYCDAGVSQVSWTNSERGTSCDDGKFCSGTDTCNGEGSCNHQYPVIGDFDTYNRCESEHSESEYWGNCWSPVCVEERGSCILPEGATCAPWDEFQCSPSAACSGVVQRRRVEQTCTGLSSACNGEVIYGEWQDYRTCAAGDECRGGWICAAGEGSECWYGDEDASCAAALGCEETFCDPSTNQCWTVASAAGGAYSHAEAMTYCGDLRLHSRDDWRLPTLQEFLAASRGCNGFTGEAQAVEYPLDCTVTGDAVADCAACPAGGGPTDGCYSVTGFVPCDLEPVHMTDTPTGTASEYYTFSFREASVGVTSTSAQVRCVLDR